MLGDAYRTNRELDFEKRRPRREEESSLISQAIKHKIQSVVKPSNDMCRLQIDSTLEINYEWHNDTYGLCYATIA